MQKSTRQLISEFAEIEERRDFADLRKTRVRRFTPS
jgi:hypothetical protein